MNVLLNIALAVQMLSAVAMIGLILIQHGKGADAGAGFGGGAASGTLFGATGGANFLSRTTAILAAVFLTTTLVLSYFGNARPASSGSVLEAAGKAPVAPAVEQAPAPAPVASGAAQIPTK
ncbi:MAG: preprotein translocase subunit SecG [Pseudomonadota bacterium]|jgi:preprotein translocase subunit SecG